MDRKLEESYRKNNIDLCDRCKLSYGGGCKIWPPIKLVTECVEYVAYKDNLNKTKG